MRGERFAAGGLDVLRRLEDAGFETYFVGGCVRDILMGRSPSDFDLCTAAFPEEMQAALSDFRLLETGLKHGTLTVLTHDGAYEVTTFRTESGYSDMRHPDGVTFVRSLREDLRRRDFTVNAMAWNPERGLVDLFGGREDMENRVLRCVGEPEERFTEDALRILRAMRFGAKLGFSIHPDTARAMEKLSANLRFVSAERRFSELFSLFSHPFPEKHITDFPGVMTCAVPCLSRETIFSAAPVLAALPAIPEARFAALLRNTDAGEILSALKCSRAFRESVLLYIREAALPAPESAPEMRRLLHRLKGASPEPLFALWAALRGKDISPVRALYAREKGACVSIGQLAVGGSDLAAAGVPLGKETGACLSMLLEAVMDGRCENERSALLALAERREEHG